MGQETQFSFISRLKLKGGRDRSCGTIGSLSHWGEKKRGGIEMIKESGKGGQTHVTPGNGAIALGMQLSNNPEYCNHRVILDTERRGKTKTILRGKRGESKPWMKRVATIHTQFLDPP